MWLKLVIGYWLYVRPDGATREKILDGNEEWSDVRFGAPRW
jgi:hypothetical protein